MFTRKRNQVGCKKAVRNVATEDDRAEARRTTWRWRLRISSRDLAAALYSKLSDIITSTGMENNIGECIELLWR